MLLNNAIQERHDYIAESWKIHTQKNKEAANY